MTRASLVFLSLVWSLGSTAPAFAAEPVADESEGALDSEDELATEALQAAPEPAPAPEPEPAPVPQPAASGEGLDETLKVGIGLTGAGAGLGIASGLLTHFAFTPPCRDIDDILQCEIPSASELLGRRVMISLGGTFSIGGAVLGGLGGGRLARGLALEATDANRDRRRTLVTGIGAGTLSLGLAQAVAGATMVALGVGGALETVPVTNGSEEQDQIQRDAINDRLRDVKVARSGLAMLLVSPTLIATGAAMLYRRKAFTPRRVEVSFAASPTEMGVVLRGRF